MTDYQFFVSPIAAEQIKKQLIKRGTPDAYVRIGVKGGGCSGFSYVFRFEDIVQSKDLIFETEGARIIIDPKSIILLNGVTLDWENTLMNQGFKFVNPNEKSRCGCGHSFTI